MASLPVLSSREAVKAFQKVGFVLHRQREATSFYHANGRHLSVPDHRELDRAGLRAVIRGAAITVEEFVVLL
jgi:predicted RNA binding protein YcfA (HicA-like mRNA interferase family)